MKPTTLLRSSLVLSAAALALVGSAAANTSHAGWPHRTGMLLMNKRDQSRPLDGRAGNDPFGGADSSYSCDGVHKSSACIAGVFSGVRLAPRRLRRTRGPTSCSAAPPRHAPRGCPPPRDGGPTNPPGPPSHPDRPPSPGPPATTSFARDGGNNIEKTGSPPAASAHFRQGRRICWGAAPAAFFLSPAGRELRLPRGRGAATRPADTYWGGALRFSSAPVPGLPKGRCDPRTGHILGTAGDQVRPQRRRPHRLPGLRRGRARPRAGQRVSHPRRAGLGARAGGAVPRGPGLLRPRDQLRPSRLGAVGPGGRGPHPRAAHGRRARRDGRRRLGAGGAGGDLGGRPDEHPVRRHLPRPRPGARLHRRDGALHLRRGLPLGDPGASPGRVGAGADRAALG